MACNKRFSACAGLAGFLLIMPFSMGVSHADSKQDIGVGTQYDTAHVYVAPDVIDTFIASFTATFGGHASSPIVANVLPVPSKTAFQAAYTPSGNLSVFAYQTPVPYPFGQERCGYLVSDMDRAVEEARKDGADVLVEPFKDAIGRDAVIEWPGGVKMQLYWHFTAPSYAPLRMSPDNRVYVSRYKADEFARDFVRFGHGKVVSDEKFVDAGEIGRPGESYRRIRLETSFGKMLVLATDGHLPYPFGYETTGYEVTDLADTLAKAKAAGAQVLSPPYDAGDRMTAIVAFPGGYIAEIHALKAQ